MKTFVVRLNSVDKVREFIHKISKYDFDADLVSDRYIIDAKSITGIFSLNLSRDIELRINSDNSKDVNNFIKDIDGLLVK